MPPEPLDGRGGHGLGRLGVGHVDRGRPGLVRPSPVMPSATVVGAVAVDVGHHHRGARSGQGLGVGLADAAGRRR